MDPPSERRFTFGQLSLGLQIILIFILLGSCAGASNNSVTDEGATQSEVQAVNERLTSLEREIRRLRRDIQRAR